MNTTTTALLAGLRDPDGTHYCPHCATVHGTQDWACPADGNELLLN